MTEVVLKILGFLVFTKLFLFWLWLWQLKEYHLGRFLAHFETDVFLKVISSFWRRRIPKFTPKTAVIAIAGILGAGAYAFYFDLISVLLLIVFAPIFSALVVFAFQIPTVILRTYILVKARKKRLRFKNLLVIGITGSYGKTSMKEFLYRILADKYEDKVLKTREHQNSEMGISRCVLNELKPHHEIFVCEMGAYNVGGIKLLCSIARPKWGILTGINEQHMSTFGSQENIIKGKYELIESLPKDGVAFFNAKNKYCVDLYGKTKIKKFFYGEGAHFFGEENILGAMAAAKELGMTEDEVCNAVSKIENRFGGITKKTGFNGLNIIDATYSANPDGVIAHLEYMRKLPGKKIIAMPCLIELGKASKEAHRRIGKKIAEICDLSIITTRDRFKEIRETAGDKAILIENPQSIFEKIKEFTKAGDTILLESRVPKSVISMLEARD